MKITRWLREKAFWLRTGMSVQTLNDGKPVRELVISYDNLYLGIMLDAESGTPTGDFAWSEDPLMFHVPIREHLVAERRYK